jgi:four helix bundle suffix protein
MSDQMVQAARRGRKNIAEGSRAAATSSQTELRLVNVARASLEELLLDYEDFLRHRRLRRWAPEGPEALAVREIGHHSSDRTDLSDEQRYARYAPWLDHDDPAVRANALLCLINQANYLLDKQIAALEAQFIEEGGYSEQLAVARLAKRAADRAQPKGQARGKAILGLLGLPRVHRHRGPLSDPSDPTHPSDHRSVTCRPGTPCPSQEGIS